MSKQELITSIAIAILVLLASWFWSSDSIIDAPMVEFKTIDGVDLDLQGLRGKVVLVHFWATSCPTCIEELPDLISLYEEFGEHGLEIIGVAMPYDPPNQVLSLVAAKKIPYPIALDIDGTATQAFGDVTLTPSNFLISPNGKLVKHVIGNFDLGEIRDRITLMLAARDQL